MYIKGRKRTLADKTFYQNGSIDISLMKISLLTFPFPIFTNIVCGLLGVVQPRVSIMHASCFFSSTSCDPLNIYL